MIYHTRHHWPSLQLLILLISLITLTLLLAPGCSDDGGGGDAAPPEPCPAERVEAAKVFLAAGNGDAARASFLSIMEDNPGCTDAHFGLVLADQLRFMDIADKLLSLVLDPLEKRGQISGKGPIDVGAIIVDYAENLLEPIVREMLEHLAFCQAAGDLRFDLERLPFEILGLEILVYAGEYDHGDVLLQSAEFNLIAAGLDTILSVDLSFDIQIIIDHFQAWEGMDPLSIVADVVDMILEILDDPSHPGFLRLRDEGLWRMPRAGLEMGRAYEFMSRAVDAIRSEPIDSGHDVTGCGDRNGNGLCDPKEFIHGLIYSLPSDLHAELQEVERALRDSYWDGTELDSEPGTPNPFTLDRLGPILRYFGLPPLIPPLPVDFGAMYAEPDPNGIRGPFRAVLLLLDLILGELRETAPARSPEVAPATVSGADPDAGEVLLTAAGVPQGPPAVGLDTASDIAALPYIDPTARTLQLSSHDPTGGNEDGYIPPNHLYVDEHGEFVLFDAFGPGCIYRIWFTNTWSFINNMRIYVDDMEIPAVEGPLLLLFLGGFGPFTEPLAYNWSTSSGGCTSYLPIPFAGRCRITMKFPPEYYNITYVRYSADTPVRSFTGAENTLPLRWQLSRPGTDPKPPVSSSTIAGVAGVAPGASVPLAEIDSSGAVWRFFLAPEPFTQEAVGPLWLRAWWDGADTPAVDAPLPEFFGSLFIEDAPAGLLVGRDGERFYCYFPMPFCHGARLEIENRGETAVEVAYEIEVAEDTYGPGAGAFRAIYSEEDPVPVGLDYLIGGREGRAGKFVGLTHTMRGPRSRWYLEGDERFYVDGSASPALYGTGTEDYYNSGWYFIQGTYDRPLWGNPSHHSFPDHDLTGTYRLHIGDAVHYLDDVWLGIEHGGVNEGGSEHYTSVAYFYELDRSLLRPTDALDVGDPASEGDHGYAAVLSDPTGELTSFYEGDDDDVPVTDSGRIVKGESRFRISVDPANRGVLLRRRFDQANSCQQARVLVGGVDAGTWYTPESSQTLRWAEDDFVLPASATAGKVVLEITIQVEGKVPWTEYAYWAYSIM